MDMLWLFQSNLTILFFDQTENLFVNSLEHKAS